MSSCSTMNRAKDLTDVDRKDPKIVKLLEVIQTYGRTPDSLIQVLHAAQNLYGYLPLPVIRFIAKELKAPPSRVMGVVTFYHLFSLKPKGEHNCLVCTGTACYVKGAPEILRRIEERFGLKPGDSTPDHKMKLETGRCIGPCEMAPAVVYDDQFLSKAKADDVIAAMKTGQGK